MVRIASISIACVVVVAVSMPWTAAKGGPPIGLLAASSGNEVFIVDPATGSAKSVESGPVAWLFPAPGGILFAPDLVNGRTTVVDLRTQTVREPIPGVTMPRFGALSDRYLVLAKQLLVVSYPDRALMNRFEISFERPWQVAVAAENTVLLVLERGPEDDGEVIMTAVELGEGRLVYRRQLRGDVRHFALSLELGLMALAEAEGHQVVLVDPASLTPAAGFAISGIPVDLVFADDGTTLIVAVQRPDGGGELLIWKIKSSKKAGVQRKKEQSVPLGAAPVRLAASPDGRHVAAGLIGGGVQVVELESQAQIAERELPETLRDLVWCDPAVAGPLLPDWSDDDEPKLDLSGG